MSGSRVALRIGAFAIIALAVLQMIWHQWMFPSVDHAIGMFVLTTVPLLLTALVAVKQRRRGVLIGGMLCLAYFSHGVTSAWSEPASRGLALVEIALSLIVIGASGWDARGYKRRKA